MDLNIGTAFWFASRGQGYLHSYSDEELELAYAANSENDRPLLRLGEEAALKSVGLNVTDVRSREKYYQREINTVEEPIACSDPQCKRVSKLGCVRNMCKKCCDRAHREEQLLIDISTRSLFLQNSCPAHKMSDVKLHKVLEKAEKKKLKKVTNRISEKEELEIVHNICVEQCSSEKVDNGHPMTSDLTSQVEIDTPYLSTCKILLVGLGADEQLAGYGRHRTCFAQGGWDALCKELNLDLERLWTRNLGR
jgi:3-dehydroquinate synthase class II